MGGVRRHESPTGFSAPTKVGFAATLVTGVSRPLRRQEHWTIYYFEKHAAKCRDCRNPDQVQKEGQQLCPEGFDYAADIADLLFKLRLDGEVYCTAPREGQAIRVEIPPDYHNVISLLKAFRRSGSGLIKESVSYDRNYPIGPRLARSDSVKEPREPVSPSLPYNTKTFEPPSPPRKIRRRRFSSERMSRGSLHELDERAQREADMRERLCQYDLEIRKPFFSRTQSIR